eukprot:Gb_04699 [translate_table: standard]
MPRDEGQTASENEEQSHHGRLMALMGAVGEPQSYTFVEMPKMGRMKFAQAVGTKIKLAGRTERENAKTGHGQIYKSAMRNASAHTLHGEMMTAKFVGSSDLQKPSRRRPKNCSRIEKVLGTSLHMQASTSAD